MLGKFCLDLQHQIDSMVSDNQNSDKCVDKIVKILKQTSKYNLQNKIETYNEIVFYVKTTNNTFLLGIDCKSDYFFIIFHITEKEIGIVDISQAYSKYGIMSDLINYLGMFEV